MGTFSGTDSSEDPHVRNAPAQPRTAFIQRSTAGWFFRTCSPPPPRQGTASEVTNGETLDRGIPAGYVNALEKRLAETERALFLALAETRFGTRSDVTAVAAMKPSVLFRSTPTTQQEKAELMAAWGSTPLEERAQVEAWFEANAAEGACGLQTIEGPAHIGSLAAQTHHGSQLGVPPRLGMRAQRTRRVARQSPTSRGGTTARPTLSQMSRASKFANDNKNLYF